MTSSFPERLKIIVDQVGNASRLGKLAGISYKSISGYLAGSNDPSRERLVAIAKAANVNLLWLATGEGPMRSGDTPDPAQPQEKAESAEERSQSPVDMELLTDIIRALENALAQTGRTLAPNKKAEVIAILYELEQRKGSQEDSTQTVERILRLVS